MNRKRVFKREISWILFFLPALAVYSIVVIIPTISTFALSFTDYNGLSTDFSFLGLSNYISVFQNESALSSIFNSLIYGITVPVLVTLLAIPLALVLNSRIKSKNILRAIFFFPSVISTLFLGYIWKFILSSSSTGLINSIRVNAGSEPLLLLADPKYAMLFLILITVWSSTGWHACIYIANLQTISHDYYEAATLDGASGWQKFRYITLPMLAPSMTSSVLLLLTGSLKAYDLPYALTGGGPGSSTTMITQTIIEEGVTANRVGYASAMSFLFLIVIAVITVSLTRYMNMREKRLYE
ncbi:MAG TPA: sugar ABC transporter permease [Candidatus Sellimonas avistercoris]|nr:sugar ABC transporter permease [Candidatus Sellimonas avistercoris]